MKFAAAILSTVLTASAVVVKSASAFAFPHHHQISGSKVATHASLSSSSSTYIRHATFLSATKGGDTDAILPEFSSLEEYMDYLSAASSLPKGFATGTASGTFISKEAPALGPLPIKGTVIHLTEGATDSWAACFTSNKFPGAPIKVGRSRLEGGGPIQAIVVNNKISNVCSGGDGVADSEMVCEAVAMALDLEGGAKVVLPSSTGVIGWRLPAKELAEDVVPKAVESLQTESALNAARDIMTTDRYPKLRSRTLSNGARLVGVAKGAGMIEPNMATMLCYLMTDATIEKASLQKMLSGAVDNSFNSISVDGDESTSDTTVLVASNQVPTDDKGAIEAEFNGALLEVMTGLAGDLVRNGEGTGHVMRVQIDGYPGTDKEARFLGRWIVNSPLFKCAVSGNDPNTGRLAGAIGSFMGKFNGDANLSDVTLSLGGRAICAEERFILEGDEVEKELSNHMKIAQLGEVDEYPQHQKYVEIGVDFGKYSGDGSATVLGSDLTAEYVSVNADYRS
mmetsp:Transcript_16839/g.39909  ORF Transcript_16839/g.39909 Transcript_16839/m.39909 type:complete len:510 (+) Transcript_16839:194-1723(+)